MIKYIIGIYVLMSMVVGIFVQKPHHCKSPHDLSGHFCLSSANMRMITATDGEYIYNAVDQRIRMVGYGYRDALKLQYVTPTRVDVLLHYNEHIAYAINEQNHTCVKHPLKGKFHPLKIPQNATLGVKNIGVTHIIGSSSDPLEGLRLACWTGKLPEEKAMYESTFTMSGCIPVSNAYYTELIGLISMSFTDNVLGIDNPHFLDPPSYCQDPDQQTHHEPADFYSLLLKPLVESN